MKFFTCCLIGLALLALGTACRTPCRGIDSTTVQTVHMAPAASENEYVRGQAAGGMTTPFPTFNGFVSTPTTNSSATNSSTTGASTTGTSTTGTSTTNVGANGTAVSPSNTVVSGVADRTAPPAESGVPKVARNTYGDSLERLPAETDSLMANQRVNGSMTTVPSRTRESVGEKASSEQEQNDLYRQWLQEQKKTKKGSKSVPRYLQPLTSDRSVFDDPNSPFARKQRAENDRRFVRQITAADLNMMQDVGSTRELLDWEKEQDLPVDWSKYSAKNVWHKWRDWLGMGPDQKEAIALMVQAAEKHMAYEETKDKKKLKEAAELYEKAGKKWPDSVLHEDALFYAGECQFFLGDYTKALQLYAELVTKYSNSILKRDATHRLYMIGCFWAKCYEAEGAHVNVSDSSKPRFSTFAGAKKAFETIFINDASESGFAPDALFALANAYMRRGVQQGDASFESAAKYYRQLYEFYPGCKHAEKAYLLAMVALHKAYLGPFYDDRPLRQAREIALLAQRTGRGDRDLILAELESINEEQAGHLWARGLYYEKQGKFGSSRNYYNRLVREFPNSRYTEMAVARYNEIKDRPVEVDQYAWIRPVAPFMPKPNTDYFEDRPEPAIQMAARGDLHSIDRVQSTDYTQLDPESAKDSPARGGDRVATTENAGKETRK